MDTFTIEFLFFTFGQFWQTILVDCTPSGAGEEDFYIHVHVHVVMALKGPPPAPPPPHGAHMHHLDNFADDPCHIWLSMNMVFWRKRRKLFSMPPPPITPPPPRNPMGPPLELSHVNNFYSSLKKVSWLIHLSSTGSEADGSNLY